jgi:hypothetical protein
VLDPISGNLTFDQNTIGVIPGPRASGYQKPVQSNSTLQHNSGTGNGTIELDIINDLEIIDNSYVITFSDTLYQNDSLILAKNYSVRGENSKTESFYLFDTKFARLSSSNIIKDEKLAVENKEGKIYEEGKDYELDYLKGAIKRTDNSSMPNNSEFIITYNYFSIYQSTALFGEDTNPVFDGQKLFVNDRDAFNVDFDKTGWTSEDITIPFTISLASIGPFKIKYPADYLITFSDDNISTAKIVASGQFADVPVKYKVEEITHGLSTPILTLLNERGKADSAWTRGDEIIFFKPGSAGLMTDTLTWGITFSRVSEEDSIVPGNGDSFSLYTKRPFTTEDVFSFNSQKGVIKDNIAKSSLDNIYVVPNPYVGANEIEPANRLAGQTRGERRIYFENLPPKCTIRIFTLSGDLVTLIEHDEGVASGREYWNLLNKDGFSVSYGVYIAHVDAPGIGETLVKFAL